MNSPENGGPTEYKVYKRRYLISFLLCIFVTTTLFEMTVYTSNANVITVYYGVNYVDVTWTLLVASFSSLVFFYPTMKCVELFGLRLSMILSTAVNALGASIKCVAIRRDYFWLLMVGQSMQSAVTLFPFSLMPALGEHWFRREEMGNLMGVLTSLMTLGPISTFT
ncbi:feline leukemia virus subgroup C receptor-related protein 2-like protein, partial [Leptotrombidium deliense]